MREVCVSCCTDEQTEALRDWILLPRVSQQGFELKFTRLRELEPNHHSATADFVCSLTPSYITFQAPDRMVRSPQWSARQTKEAGRADR